jgi:hypothetical protein
MSPVLKAWFPLVCTLALAALGCGGKAEATLSSDQVQASATNAPAPDPYQDFPLYGLVSGAQLTVRDKPEPTALTLGWLRRGEIVRLKPEPQKSPTCASGWYRLHPRGFACAGEGIKVSDKPPTVADEDRAQARRDQPMPYDYYFVKEARAAEYHQLPSRDQQRSVRDYVTALLGVEAEGNARKLALFLEGKLPKQPTRHAVVRRLLDRGFFVTGTSVAVRSSRRFVHTVRGSFIKEQELAAKTAPSFQGVELGNGRALPVVWAVRTGVPQVSKLRADGTTRLSDAEGVAPIERLALVNNWKGWARVDGQLMHELSDGTYLRDWFLAVAEKMARPKEVKSDEPWVHVDLGEQTLVLYVGDEPKYATLVSSGSTDHKTPVGSFRIQRKYVSDTMADIGEDAKDERYSIDDVPWTQYFDGAKALHGAFWHSQFGIQRSHGCVNLAPKDAFYVFQHTWPEVPAGWHGISTQLTKLTGSLVVITD